MRFLLILILAILGYLGWSWHTERQKNAALEAEVAELREQVRKLERSGAGGNPKDWREARERRWKTPQQAAHGPARTLEDMSEEERRQTLGR
jgi:Tfp pilus assembly protein PilN